MNKKKSVLIVGGSRFVGPYLIKLLIKSGADVTVFNRGTIRQKYTGVTYVQGDRHTDLARVGKRTYDVVYDMCAYTGADTKELLKRVSFKFLVHFGSVASYAAPTTFPIREDHPQGEWFWSDYGAGKAECERVLKSSGKQYAILRPTYVLGVRNYVDREHFLYNKIRKNEPIHIPGDGRALVQFVFVEEVAQSLFALGSQRAKGAYNCAGDDAITLTELVNQMALLVGKKPQIVYDTVHDADAWDDAIFPFANEHSLYDSTKIKSLGITFVPLLKGLKRDWTKFYMMR